MEKHIPVLLDECIKLLEIKKDGLYLDLTVGRAGHSREILKRLDKNGFLIGVDRDLSAIEESQKILSKISSNFKLIHSNFTQIDSILNELGLDKVDGVIMDLGVSSPQFDEGDRGFSYREDAPLDMRMDKSQNLSAYQIVNTYSLQQLNRIFREYGEDKYSYNVAKNIVKEREKKPIETTFELVDIIKASKPNKELKKIGHPAKQIFQALRIEVNDELNSLSIALDKIVQRLKRGGILEVITFHSLEDRIVKHKFKNLCEIKGNREDIPDVKIDIKYQLLTRKPIISSEEEINNNHRAKSAKLRAIKKIKD